jgi:ATP-dependent DNA ligase
MNKTLYKKDTKGKIRILELSTEGSLFIQTSGIIDGKLVRHEKECKPKNVGKSNSTSAVEQAIAECNAKYEIKLSEGYFSSREEAEKEEVLMPMLAKVYEDHSSKINWDGDVFIQPKLDGMRCLVS